MSLEKAKEIARTMEIIRKAGEKHGVQSCA